MTSAAVGGMELDAQLTSSGEAVGQGDDAPLVAVDGDVRPQFASVEDAWVVVHFVPRLGKTWGPPVPRAVSDTDPPAGANQVAQ